MNYSASLRYLNSFLNLERIQLQASYAWNLERMQFLLQRAGHPEKNYFPILIAGTKGKGSTGFFLESILRASGIPVGFYSSPHLEDPRERIRLNGKMISKGLWSEQVEKIKQLLGNMSSPRKRGSTGFMDSRFRGNDKFTYFEIMTLMAMTAFRDQKVRIGIFEVGMGGRLDATNALKAPLAILTPIHLDHEAILGPTIAKIAREKAGIIKSKAQVVVSPQNKEAMKEILMRSKSQGAQLHPVAPLKSVGLMGDYQAINGAAARKAAEILRKTFSFNIKEDAIVTGLQAKNWPGRMESFIKGKTEFLLDGAHNPISIEALVRNLKKLHPHRKRLLIFGTARDKKSQPMLQALSRYFPEIVLTSAPNPRSIEVETLLLQSRGLFSRIYPAGSVAEALKLASEQMREGLIVITGSFYLIGEARKQIN